MPSIRVNTLRISPAELKSAMGRYGKVETVPWYPSALIVQGENLANTQEYQLGYFYLQSLASMLPVIALDPQPGEHILDLAAAPGSKATQIAQHMKNSGILIANDDAYMRLKPLGGHIGRLGILNCAVTEYDGRKLPSIMHFHRVLLDAPCSGLGSRFTHSPYSPNRLRQMCKLQKQLLVHAFDLLLPGGRLIYSTCTTRNEENEEVVQRLLDKRSDAKLEKPGLPVPHTYGPGARIELDEFFFIAQLTRGE
ncbi:MAG TPA: RsmB/NOP family class I SAM-dependent RNA methyltransferase [Candidatus Bilamarchaeaceae archaeon]|nr:RsmB/NOP family class I SAM-dependent RNA methyltransferase [Candidatus Bilamarchaeaceae archaeon]